MKPYLYAFGAILCWASLPAAVGSGLGGLSTPELMFYSFTAAAIFLYGQSLILTRSWKIYVPRPAGLVFGLFGIFLYHWVYYLAVDNAPIAEAAILTTTWSFWIVVFSAVLAFRRLPLPVAVLAVVGLVGAASVVSAGKSIEFDMAHMKGYLFALSCGLIWSSFSVFLPRMKFTGDPMTAFTIITAVASAILFAVSAPHPMPVMKPMLASIYLGCVPLGLSFYLWNKGLTTGNVSVIGFLSYLTPPLAVLMVALIHGEHVHPQALAGMGLILVSAIAGNWFLSRKKA